VINANYCQSIISTEVNVQSTQDETRCNSRPQSTSHRLVVHVGLVLVDSPQTRDGLRVDQFEDASLAVDPSDVARTVLGVL